jgi:hypothetical protein
MTGVERLKHLRLALRVFRRQPQLRRLPIDHAEAVGSGVAQRTVRVFGGDHRNRCDPGRGPGHRRSRPESASELDRLHHLVEHRARRGHGGSGGAQSSARSSPPRRRPRTVRPCSRPCGPIARGTSFSLRTTSSLRPPCEGARRSRAAEPGCRAPRARLPAPRPPRLLEHCVRIRFPGPTAVPFSAPHRHRRAS